MLRKMMLTGIAAVGLAVPLTISASADAHPPHYHHYHKSHYRWGHWCEDFAVFYRPNCSAPWSCYGDFQTRYDAANVMRDLQARGYEVMLEGD